MDEEAWKNFSDQVKSQVDIVEVVGRYVDLKKKGNSLFGLCPFHSEKTPSFSVSPEKQLFHCFGCGAGGDAIKFVSLINNISYSEAVRRIAEEHGIEWYGTRKEDAMQTKFRKDLYEVYQRARNFFHNALKIPSYGKKGMEYLESRGISIETIDQFEIGFAPDSWNKLSTSFQERGYSRDLLIRAGLILQSKKYPDRYYDRFRNRVIIPIFDEQGRVVGFGGRSIDGSEPKYLNSSESLIFNKRRILFGLNRASRAITQKKYAIICEGYLDAIALATYGIENVVATLGTAFTADHVNLLSRYTRRFYLCYDSDNAGQHATIRAISIAESHDVEVRVIQIPDAKDPDEYLRKHSRADFENLIEKSESAFEYQVDFKLNQASDLTSIEGRARTLREILPILKKQKQIEQKEYIRKLATKLFIEETTIARELENFDQKSNPSPTEPKKDSRGGAIIMGGRFIIALLLDSPEMLENVLEFLPEGFPDPIQQEIFTKIKKGEPLENLSPEATKELSLIANLPDENKIKAYQDSLHKLRINYLKQKRQSSLQDGDYESAKKIQKEINDLKAEFAS